MAMHRRMPIVAAIKSRVHRARAAHIGGVINRVIGFVRIFLADAFQRQARKMRGLRLRERKLILLRLLRWRERWRN